MRKQAALILCLTPLLFTGLLTTVNAQTETYWTKTYGKWRGDYANSVQQTSDGGYIATGTTSSNNSDVFLLKTDASGKAQWRRTFGSEGNDYGYSVQQTPDGGYIIVAATNTFDPDNSDVWLIKTDVHGEMLWQKKYGGTGWDYGYSIQLTSDNGYIIAGSTDSFGAGHYDVYLIKTDSMGNILWQKTFGGTGDEAGNSVQLTSDGGYIIVGYTGSFGSLNQVYLVKTDSSGRQMWTRTYGGSGEELGYSVQQTSDGGYIITGETTSFGAGGSDVYLIKTDASGNLLWQKTYGGKGNDGGFSVQITPDGGYIIAGYTSSFGVGGLDVYLVKTDVLGNLRWQRTYGGLDNDIGYSIQLTADGGFIVAGNAGLLASGGSGVYLVKTDSSGDAHLPRSIFIDQFVVTDPRCDVSSIQFVRVHAKWGNGTDVRGGSIKINDDSTLFNATGWANLSEVSNVSAKRVYFVKAVSCLGVTNFTQAASSLSIIWDRVRITQGGVSNHLTKAGNNETVWFKAVYEYDNSSFTGEPTADGGMNKIFVNGVPMAWSSFDKVWKYSTRLDDGGMLTFEVTGVEDMQYKLTKFVDDAGPLSITWEKPFLETQFGLLSVVALLAVITTVVIFFMRKRI